MGVRLLPIRNRLLGYDLRTLPDVFSQDQEPPCLKSKVKRERADMLKDLIMASDERWRASMSLLQIITRYENLVNL